MTKWMSIVYSTSVGTNTAIISPFGRHRKPGLIATPGEFNSYRARDACVRRLVGFSRSSPRRDTAVSAVHRAQRWRIHPFFFSSSSSSLSWCKPREVDDVLRPTVQAVATRLVRAGRCILGCLFRPREVNRSLS